MPNTPHANDITGLRNGAPLRSVAERDMCSRYFDEECDLHAQEEFLGLIHQGYLLNNLAADLLEMHDATGISLDKWTSAREFVESRIGHPITENGV